MWKKEKGRERENRKRSVEKTGGRINEHTTGKQTQERRLREEKVQEREESKNVK